jgi:hypothetical protein
MQTSERASSSEEENALPHQEGLVAELVKDLEVLRVVLFHFQTLLHEVTLPGSVSAQAVWWVGGG